MSAERVAPVRPTAWRIVVWAVAAVVFAYVTVQAVGNLVGVQQLIRQYNDFVGGSSVGARSVPWAYLVLDVVMAPAAYVAAWFTSRRMGPLRTVLVFGTALCAVSALWFSLSQLVEPSVTL